MKYLRNRNRVVLCIYILAVIIQKIYFRFSGRTVYQYTFAYGLFREKYAEGILYLDVLALCLPVIFLLLYFSGNYTNYVEGYGRLLIIRNYSKRKMIWKQCLSMAGRLFLLTILEIVLWKIQNQSFESFKMPLYQVFLTYYLCVCAMIFLQYFFETFLSVQAANLTVVFYFVISEFVVEKISNHFLKFFFFPVFITAKQICIDGSFNRITGVAGIQMFLASLSFVFIALSVFRCKRKDIY